MNNSIVIISALFPPEPVVSAKISFDIAEKLSDKVKVEVLHPKPTRPKGYIFPEFECPKEIIHYELNSYTNPGSSFLGRFWESFSFGYHTFRFVVKNHTRISKIYANTWPIFAQYFALIASKLFHIPIIFHIQDIYPESIGNKLGLFSNLINKILIPLDRYILSRASKVIVISGKMKKHLITTRKLHDNKIVVIRNWQDESLFAQNLNHTINLPFIFMYLGSISPAAGVDLLIHSFQRTGLINTRLVIAGNGSDKEKCKKIARIYNNENIEFIDAPPHLVPSIQSNADILLLPLKRGFGLTASPSKFCSYLFSRKPIIASVDEESDTAEAIKNANCGWVVLPEDVDSLAKSMIQARTTSPEEFKKLGQNGYDYAMANYSKKENLNKILKIILEENE